MTADELTMIERLRMCADELKEVTAAADDPRINLTITLAEYMREVKDEIERLRADAERYRWLRDNAYQCADTVGPLFRIDVRRTEKTLFNFGLAIDVARKEERK